MAEWAKLHTDILSDPKLMRASRKGAKALLYLPWLIAFAKRADDGGRLTVDREPAEPEDYLQSIPCATEKGVVQAIDDLEKLGILARELDGALSFSAWTHRQSKPSDDPDAVRQRVKRHRVKRKALKDTIHVTPGNACETPDGNAIEVEGEIEEEGDTTDVTRDGNWIIPFAKVYDKFIGKPSFARIGKALKPLREEYGDDLLLSMWEDFCEYGPHLDAKGIPQRDINTPHFCTPEKFAGNHRFWADRARPLTIAKD